MPPTGKASACHSEIIRLASYLQQSQTLTLRKQAVDHFVLNLQLLYPSSFIPEKKGGFQTHARQAQRLVLVFVVVNAPLQEIYRETKCIRIDSRDLTTSRV